MALMKQDDRTALTPMFLGRCQSLPNPGALYVEKAPFSDDVCVRPRGQIDFGALLGLLAHRQHLLTGGRRANRLAAKPEASHARAAAHARHHSGRGMPPNFAHSPPGSSPPLPGPREKGRG